jgi:ATP-dependent exoDNAse (exonuclease V) beta subunit
LPFGGGGHAGTDNDQRPALSGWLAPLNPAVYPRRENWRRAASLAGCSDFGHDSVLERPVDRALGAESVQPGLHTLREGEADEYQVAWWDPACLDLDKQPRFGLRQEELLSRSEGSDASAGAALEHTRWQEERDAQRQEAAAPSVRWSTATAFAAQLIKRHDDGEALDTVETQLLRAANMVELVELPIADLRPAGASFGSLVHAVLATASLDADVSSVSSLCRMHARILGCPEIEVHAAVDAVHATLQHPLLQKARAAMQRAACRRETPLTLRLEGQPLVEGIVDLAFAHADGWTVLDYKTDRELLERSLPVYRLQVALYALAIARATGETTRAILLRV